MVWATSALPRNEHLPGVGGGREAMADDAHGVMFIKIAKLWLTKKRGGKGSDVELGESPPTIVMIDLHTGLYVLCMATIWGQIVKPYMLHTTIILVTT
jgi:hypothetical protein